ncbi:MULTISPECIES: hypothetical protein [unclassified Mucilaginibacter]|uniref:hypothetical protein n=1 Tax=unclassified Mucilaginibacter TaxID=2617802 RepID=UPI000960FBD0|nr:MULTISPECIES: hypothetical protein [unclassified Mucilaginibacter]OJW15289.1 MAG: hypothetical protein BGO48_14260 [Mucilaginibacter sp. 44-25]PLW89533.1 MAG: hypothetical protein C0154_11060 [Mucilaginibacter sp.]HEK21072.1 hypothetical protein [Bacteroidota bacterium]
MKEQLTYTETSLPSIKQAKQSLYTSYSGMLLGYIVEVVKDRTVAEKYLIDIFTSLQANDIQDIFNPDNGSVYCRLQSYARKQLQTVHNCIAECAGQAAISSNRVTGLMNEEQQLVFCGLHYHGKSIAQLAYELKKDETAIRQILKQSFNIIRSNRK